MVQIRIDGSAQISDHRTSSFVLRAVDWRPLGPNQGKGTRSAKTRGSQGAVESLSNKKERVVTDRKPCDHHRSVVVVLHQTLDYSAIT